MTRSVWSGPPWRRGLAWGLAVLVGAAVLLGAPDGSDLAAQEKAKSALPADLALVPGEAFAFGTIRVADLWTDPATKELKDQLAKLNAEGFKEATTAVHVPPEEIERLTFVITKTPGPGDQGPVVVILVKTTKPYDKAKVLEHLLPGGKEQKRKDRTYHVLAEGGAALYAVDETTFLMGPTDAVEGVMDQAGQRGGTLAPALALAAQKHTAVGGIRPSALLDTVGNMIPAEVAGLRTLLEAPVAYGTLDFGKESKVQARMVCNGEREAKDSVTAAKGLIALFQQFAQPEAEKQLEKLPKGKVDHFRQLFKDFTTALKDLPIEAKDKDVTATLALKADLATISQGVVEGLFVARGAAGELNSANNLKQMAIAMHNYHDTMGSLPPAAISDKDGKPLLSWRVAILPYVEHDALYRSFKLDEPWDSEHNKKLLDQMPPVYRMPRADGADPNEKVTTTHYRVFHGKGAIFEGAKGTTLADITDGTSNTILIVEATDAVPWTKPDELPFDPKKDLPKLGLKNAEKFNAGFADGSVHVLSKKIDKDTLKALITRNGGEVVKIPDD
jgi:hypothetical protein